MKIPVVDLIWHLEHFTITLILVLLLINIHQWNNMNDKWYQEDSIKVEKREINEANILNLLDKINKDIDRIDRRLYKSWCLLYNK